MGTRHQPGALMGGAAAGSPAGSTSPPVGSLTADGFRESISPRGRDVTGGFSHQTDNRLAGFPVVTGTIDFSRQHRLESGSLGNCHCELTPRPRACYRTPRLEPPRAPARRGIRHWWRSPGRRGQVARLKRAARTRSCTGGQGYRAASAPVHFVRGRGAARRTSRRDAGDHLGDPAASARHRAGPAGRPRARTRSTRGRCQGPLGAWGGLGPKNLRASIVNINFCRRHTLGDKSPRLGW